MDNQTRVNSATELTFVKPGDQFCTRAGFLATVERVDGFRVLGCIDTDYMRTYTAWRQDGTGEQPCDDLTDFLSSAPPKRSLFQRIFG
jgi:hypothetical protein